MKHNKNFWREECNYISRVCDKKGKVKEMNYDTEVFKRYCEMQRNQAEKEKFYDVVQYIQHCIDDLEPFKQNPRRKIARKQPNFYYYVLSATEYNPKTKRGNFVDVGKFVDEKTAIFFARSFKQKHPKQTVRVTRGTSD